MKVSVLIYKHKDRYSITKANHELFGRLAKSNKKTYYYPGKLEDVSYYKATNGCYFIVQEENNTIEETDLYCTYPILLTENKFTFKTAKQHWIEHARKRNIVIKNLKY